MQSGSAFFLVAVLGLVVSTNYMFILFVVLGGVLRLTSRCHLESPLVLGFLIWLSNTIRFKGTKDCFQW